MTEAEQLAVDAIAHAAYMVHTSWQEAAGSHMRPSVLFKPALSLDGNQWCALYGANIQEGFAAFGDSPAQAMWAFDKAWNESTTQQKDSQA